MIQGLAWSVWKHSWWEIEKERVDVYLLLSTLHTPAYITHMNDDSSKTEEEPVQTSFVLFEASSSQQLIKDELRVRQIRRLWGQWRDSPSVGLSCCSQCRIVGHISTSICCTIARLWSNSGARSWRGKRGVVKMIFTCGKALITYDEACLSKASSRGHG